MTRRQILLYTSFFLVLLIGGTYALLTQTGVTKSLVRDALSRLLFHVELEDATMDPLGGTVTIKDVRISAKSDDKSKRDGPQGPGGPERTKGSSTGAQVRNGKGREVLKVKELVVGVSMNPLDGVGGIRTLRLRSPELDLYLGENEPIDFGQLVRTSADGQADFDPNDFPSLEIEDMKVRLHFVSQQQEREAMGALPPLLLEKIHLSVRREANDDKRLVLTGGCDGPFGGKIRIRGTCDIDRLELRLLAEADAFDARARDFEKLGPGIRSWMEKHEFGGRVRPSLWVSYPSKDGQVALGVRCDFEETSFRPPAFRYLLDHMSGSAAWSAENGGTLILEAKRSATDAEISGKVELYRLNRDPGVRVEVKAKDLLLTPAIRTALAGIPVAAKVYDGFSPDNGRVDLRFFVNTGGTVSRDEELVELDLDFKGIDACFQGIEGTETRFPYELKDLKGRLSVRNQKVRVPRFEAYGKSGGRIHGAVDLDFERGSAWVEVLAEDLPMSKELRQAVIDCVPSSRPAFEQFEVSGKTGLLFQASKERKEDPLWFETRLTPLSMRSRWSGFPVWVKELTGDIRIGSDDLRFAVQGKRDTGDPIELRGHLVQESHQKSAAKPSKDRPFPRDVVLRRKPTPWEIHARSKRLTLDRELRTALGQLDKELENSWRLFEPEGRIALDFLAWEDPKTGLEFDLRGNLRGVSARFSPFPAPVFGLEGSLAIQGTPKSFRTEVLGLRGKSLGSRLLLHGSLTSQKGALSALPLADLTVVAQGALIGDPLADLLIQNGFVTREVWELAQASGRIDAIHKVSRKKGQSEFQQELELDLRNVVFESKILPDRLHDVSGKIRIDQDKIAHLEGLRGMIGESELRCYAGKVEQDEKESHIYLELGSSDYPVDERLARLLDGRVKKAYLELRALGRVQVEGLGVDLYVPHDPPPTVEGTGLRAVFGSRDPERPATIRVRDLSFEAGLRFDEVSGVLTLERGRFDPEGAEFHGKFTQTKFQSLGQHFQDGEGNFVLTHEDFRVPRGKIRVHGGRMEGRFPKGVDQEGKSRPFLRYTMGEKRHFELHADCQDVSLGSLSRQFSSSQRLEGSAGGTLSLSLDVDDPTTLELEAKLGVADGQLGNVPIFTSLYSLLRPEKRPVFNAAIIDLKGKEGQISIDRFMVRSSVLKVEGSGWLSYDGYLQLAIEFPDLFPEAHPAFILPGIYKFLANGLVSYDIYGYLGNTRTSPRFLFEGTPRRVPLGPIPGKSPPIQEIFR